MSGITTPTDADRNANRRGIESGRQPLLGRIEQQIRGLVRRKNPGPSDIQSSEERIRSNHRIMLLGNSGGDVEISGGQFNAVSGNQIRVEVNVNGSETQGTPQRHIIQPMASDLADIYTAGIQDIERARSQLSPPESMPDFAVESKRLTVVPVQVPEEINSVYFRCLAISGRGSPLWIPEPNKDLSIEYRRNGFVIGDVGIITPRGWFDSLFNIRLPHGHPLQVARDLKDLPTNYSPAEIEDTKINHFEMYSPGAYVLSDTIYLGVPSESGAATFESSASEGAILILPDGSNSEELRNKKQLVEYLAVHTEEIYRCAMNVHGREIRNGDLRVVTGFDKTTKWGMGAFVNVRSEAKPRFRLKLRPDGHGVDSWESSGRTEVKAGPHSRQVAALRMGDPSQQDVEYNNQTVFLHTTTLSLKSSIWNALVSECGFGEMEGDPDTPSDSRFENGTSPGPSPGNSRAGTRGTGGQSSTLGSSFGSPTNLAIHPSTAINAILLKLNQGARMAITGDEIWCSVLQEDDKVLPSIETLWSRITELYDIRLENGVVSLEKLETPVSSIDPDKNSPPRDVVDSMFPEEARLESAVQINNEMFSTQAAGGDTTIYGSVPILNAQTTTETLVDNTGGLATIINQKVAALSIVDAKPYDSQRRGIAKMIYDVTGSGTQTSVPIPRTKITRMIQGSPPHARANGGQTLAPAKDVGSRKTPLASHDYPTSPSPYFPPMGTNPTPSDDSYTLDIDGFI